MRIGYLYGFHAYPPRGGNHLHAYQLIKWFLNRGHEVHTIGDSATPGIYNHGDDSKGIQEFLQGIEVLYIRIDARYLAEDRVARISMEEAEIPIIWEINAPANEGLAFSWLGRSRMPKDWPWNWVDKAKRMQHAARKMPKITADERIRRSYAKKVSYAICVSDAIERYAREGLGIQNTLVLANGADPDAYDQVGEPMAFGSQYDNYFKILYAGSAIYPWQGLDLLRQTAEEADRRGAKILFILLVNQDSPFIPKGKHIKVFTGVPHHEVVRYIRGVDACVAFCSDFTWSRWGFHGSPTKLFEYMGYGKAVITSRLGQMLEVIEDGYDGVLVENDPCAVLEKISYLHCNPALVQAMGKRARAKVLDKYNWRYVADNTLQVFEKAIDHRVRKISA